MSKLIEHLESFNRKERFILLNRALGQDRFSLDRRFRQELGTKIGTDVRPDAFVAMDYHLDWLQVAMWFREYDDVPTDSYHKMCRDQHGDLIEGTQEDIDLLVAFDDRENPNLVRLVLIEAKGDTSWDKKQLCSKARRLARTFGPEPVAAVLPTFVMMSPKEPSQEKLEKLGKDTWPHWMLKTGGTEVVHLDLPLAPHLLKVTRVGREGKRYKRFRVKEVSNRT